jgi:tryptophan synthase alpha chain
LDYIFEGLARHRAELPPGLVLMGYVNPFIQHGWTMASRNLPGGEARTVMAASLAHLAEKMNKAGVAGLIVPDLPLEENEPWLAALKPRGLDLIALVASNTGLEKMKAYAVGGAGGYVYVVSVLGVTGVREGLPPEVTDTLKRARQAFDLPLALGFGLTSPEQLRSLPSEERPEGAVFGSALIRHLSSGGSVRDFMAAWRT